MLHSWKDRKDQLYKVRWHQYKAGVFFLAPFIVLFTLFTIIPVAVAFFVSLTDYNMLESFSLVGFRNYLILFLEDDEFIKAIQNTLIFSLIVGPIGYLISFLMAWTINQMKGRTFFTLAFYAPSITSGVAVSVVWLYFFSNDSYGFFNYLLLKYAIVSEPVLFLSDSKWILWVVIFISIWMSMGTGFIVFIAGLKNLPQELYEAGSIDGIKSKFQELIYITIPQLKPQLLFGAIDSVVKSFAVFDIAVAVAGLPSPNYSAHTIVAHLYDHAFIRFDMGYACSIAVVLFVMTFSFGRIIIKYLSSDK